jgi:hypothetical protein
LILKEMELTGRRGGAEVVRVVVVVTGPVVVGGRVVVVGGRVVVATGMNGAVGAGFNDSLKLNVILITTAAMTGYNN